MAMESSAPTGTSSSAPKALGGDCLEVRITVLSLEGVVVKKYDPKTKKLGRKNRQKTAAATSIVASFAQDVSAGKPLLTHLPSVPMAHIDATLAKAKLALQPTVEWPSMDVGGEGDEATEHALSTLRFTRRFQGEAETFPIIISLSRRGKLINLGECNVVISRDAKGEFYMDDVEGVGCNASHLTANVPISSTIKKTGVSSPVKTSSNKNRIPMVRMKGDDLQFGLKEYSTLRVQVSVSDAQDVVTDDTDDVQDDEDFEDAACDVSDCEVNDVTYETQEEGYDSFLDFLNGEKDADAIRKQGSGSELSAENDENVVSNEQSPPLSDNEEGANDVLPVQQGEDEEDAVNEDEINEDEVDKNDDEVEDAPLQLNEVKQEGEQSVPGSGSEEEDDDTPPLQNEDNVNEDNTNEVKTLLVGQMDALDEVKEKVDEKEVKVVEPHEAFFNVLMKTDEKQAQIPETTETKKEDDGCTIS